MSTSPRLTLDEIRPLATITVDEYADLFGVSRSLSYRLASAGQIPGVFRVGRKLLISVPALLRSLEGEPEPTRLQIATGSVGGPVGTTPEWRGDL